MGKVGCTNHGCIFSTSTGGVKTNGICDCLVDVRRALGVSRYADLQTAIRGLRDQVIRLSEDYDSEVEENRIRRAELG